MAHALQKEVVAEGIERLEQLQLLKALGCDRGQGYLLGRPVSADALVRDFSAQRDYTQPRNPAPAGGPWQLPAMPIAPAIAPAKAAVGPAVSPAVNPAAKTAPAGNRATAGASAGPGKTAKPAVSQDDYWNNDLLEEALTVPRFLDEDFISPS
jgi:hypothetical protein